MFKDRPITSQGESNEVEQISRHAQLRPRPLGRAKNNFGAKFQGEFVITQGLINKFWEKLEKSGSQFFTFRDIS